MTLVPQDLYASANGDLWRLVREAGTGRLVVRHEANAASGGHVTETAVEAFLARDGAGPEHDALRRLTAVPATATATATAAPATPAIRYRPRDARLAARDAGR